MDLCGTSHIGSRKIIMKSRFCAVRKSICTFVSTYLPHIRKEQIRPSWPKRREGGLTSARSSDPWGHERHRKRGGRDMWWPSLSHASFGRPEGNVLLNFVGILEYPVFCSYCFWTLQMNSVTQDRAGPEDISVHYLHPGVPVQWSQGVSPSWWRTLTAG